MDCPDGEAKGETAFPKGGAPLSAQPIPRRGLPFWVLPAILPLALSLGFVAGMGLAHVRLTTSQGPNNRPPVQPGAPSVEQPPATTITPLLPQEVATLSPAHLQPPAPGPVADKPESGTVTQPLEPKPTAPSGPLGGPLNPDRVYKVTVPSRPAIRSIGEAKQALQDDRTGIALVGGIEYQQMRNADGSISLVGMLTVEQYLTWETILRRDPDALKRWLQAAATLVFGPEQADQFALSWALVETRVSVPSWALPSEVTPLADGRFLVVRYLAGTVGLGQPSVEVRQADSLGSPADPKAVWSRFGPQIRFDGTDIYRPSGVGTTTKTP
jgi:hypothetical protein